MVLAKSDLIIFLELGKLRSRMAESGYGSSHTGTQCPGSAHPRRTEGKVQQPNC